MEEVAEYHEFAPLRHAGILMAENGLNQPESAVGLGKGQDL